MDFDRIYAMAMGCAPLAWRAGDVSAQEARAYCLGLADAYSPAGFDVSDFHDPDLADTRFLALYEVAHDGLERALSLPGAGQGAGVEPQAS